MKLMNVIMLLIPRACLAQALAMLVALGANLVFQEPVITVATSSLCAFTMGVSTGRDLSK